MSKPSNSPLSYMPQLDGLRALAVFLVFVHHWTALHWGTGQIGVQLFFVLSGFLITGILVDLRQKGKKAGQPVHISLRQFYGRRFLRIFPLFYLTIFLLYILDLSLIREVIGWHITYLSNVGFALNGDYIGRTAHFWTLAVEEQFYLVWPILILTLPRRALLPMIVGAILSAPLFRAALYLQGYTSFVTYNLWPISNLDTLGFGSLLAILIRRESWQTSGRRLVNVAMVIGLLIYISIKLISWPEESVLRAIPMFRQSALALVLGWIIIQASYGFGGLLGMFLEWKPIIYLGKISYGLYVFHNFAPDVIRRAAPVLGMSVPESTLIRFIISFALTVFISALSWHLFEKPINSLKSNIPYLVEKSASG